MSDSDEGSFELIEDEDTDNEMVDEFKTIDTGAVTFDSVREVQETGELFKSNLFKLQIEEVLAQVQVEKNKTKKLEALLHELKNILDSLPEEVLVLKKDCVTLGVPFPLSTKNDIEFNFQAPTRVDLIGSYLVDALVKPFLNVDVSVQIPSIEWNDRLNFTYLAKRAMYLEAIAKTLKKHEAFSNLEITSFCGDKLKPIISITPANGFAKKFKIRILPCIDPTSVKSKHLGPFHTALQIPGEKINKKKLTAETISNITPYYNQLIVEDMHFRSHLDFIHSRVHQNQSVSEAIILLKLWAHKRGLIDNDKINTKFGLFNGFHFSMIIAHMLAVRKIVPQMSCYQIFRATMLYINNTDFANKGEYCGKAHMFDMTASPSATRLSPEETQLLKDYCHVFPVTMLDAEGTVNIFCRVTASAYENLKHEAKKCLTYLDDPVHDGFHAMFLQQFSYHEKYDFTCDISIEVDSFNMSNTKKPYRQTIHKALPLLDTYNATSLRIFELLKKALTDRVELINVTSLETPKWQISSSKKMNDKKLKCSFRIGFIVNSSNFHRIIDMGPSAEEQKASSEFTSFWGDRSEMRRFKDGRICETVVWEPQQVQVCKSGVVEDIVKYILNRHVSHINHENIIFIGSQFDSSIVYSTPIIDVPELANVVLDPPTIPSELEKRIETSFNTMCSIVNELELPLTIKGILATHPAMRGTALFPPLPYDLNKIKMDESAFSIEPIDVVVQFESSNRWPDDLMAISRIKSAFLLRMGTLLRQNHHMINTVGLDFIDIVQDGFVFRLRICYEREILQVKTDLKYGDSMPMLPPGTTMAFENYERDLIAKPLHASRVRGLATRFNAYGPVVKVCQRWVAAHLLSGILSLELVELMVAFTFTNSKPFAPPTGLMTGLLRFLRLLVIHNWKEEPLVVDFIGDMNMDQYTDIIQRFEHARSGRPIEKKVTPEEEMLQDEEAEDEFYPNPFIYITVVNKKNRNPSDFCMGEFHPEHIVLCQKYANASSMYLMSLLNQPATQGQTEELIARSCCTIFKTPMNAFDVTIKLNTTCFPLYKSVQRIFLSTEEVADDNEEMSDDEVVIKKHAGFKPPIQAKEVTDDDDVEIRLLEMQPITGFDQTELFLADLREQFSELAEFFYDPYDGDVIGVKWHPDIFQPKSFSVQRSSYRLPVVVNKEMFANTKKRKTSDSKHVAWVVLPNVIEILSQFRVTGGELVASVDFP